MTTAFSRLLNSSRFWLAVLDLVQVLVLRYLQIPDEVWQSIHTVILVVIAGTTVEDAAEKFGSYKEAGVIAPKPPKEQAVAPPAAPAPTTRFE